MVSIARARLIAAIALSFSRAVDRQPRVRFDNVMKSNSMTSAKRFTESNIDRLKAMPLNELRFMPDEGLEDSPNYP